MKPRNAMRTLSAALLCLLPLAGSAIAQTVPQTINFQGRLAKPDGTPVPDNNSQPVTFRIYSAATGGTLLWQQTGNVAVHNGTFAAAFDFSTGYQNSSTLASVFGNPLVTPYLEIQVGNNAALTPRQPFASHAYAFTAQTAYSVPDGSITGAKLAMGTLNSLSWLLGGNSGTNGSQYIGTTDSQPLVFKTNNAEGMRIDTAGNVLASNTLIVDAANSNDEAITGSVLRFGAVNSGEGILSKRTAGGNQYGLDFYTGSSNRMSIALNGNVGIGTSAPGVKLDVAGDIGATGLFYLRRNDPNSFISYLPQGGMGAHEWWVGSNRSGSGIAPAGSFSFFDATASATRMSLDGSGNVGIGTNTPGAKLEVAGTAKMTGFQLPTGAGAGKALLSDASGNGTWGLLGASSIADGSITTAKLVSAAQGWLLGGNASTNPSAQFLGTTDGQPVVVRTNNQERLRVDAAGNVGIGTSAPGAPLDIRNTSNGTGFQVLAGTYFGTPQSNAVTLDIPGVAGTLGVWDNMYVNGSKLSAYGAIVVDDGNSNAGLLNQPNDTGNGIYFGTGPTGEGIISPRTPDAPNHFGLDFYTARNSRMTITNAGAIGISTRTPQYTLDVNGSLRCTSFTNTSDFRYKQNIATLDNALDTVEQLRGVSFDWRKAEFPQMNFAEGRQIGFIAQEVEKVLPELVNTDKTGHKSVAYANIAAVLVEAVKTLNAKLDDKQKQMDAQKEEIAALKKQNAEIADLKKQLATVLAALKIQQNATDAGK